MRLGIMQPYFLPYIGYYSLIKHTDKWIVFDTPQFIRHGWIERNRVLKPAGGWQYIAVPLQKHDRFVAIKDLKIRDEDWKNKLYRQLEHYKKAPHYNATMNILSTCFDADTESISELNTNILRYTCQYLDINFDHEMFSKMSLDIDPIAEPGDWALNISKAYGASTYINPPGGIGLFDKEKFKSRNMGLEFLQNDLTEYNQRRNHFEAGLSIVDVLMFNSVEETNKLLDSYKITSGE